MSEPTIDKLALSHVARELESQLKALAPANSAASSVLQRYSQVIGKAIQGKIESPYQYKFLPEEFWESGALFDEMPLSETASQFNLLLRGIPLKRGNDA